MKIKLTSTGTIIRKSSHQWEKYNKKKMGEDNGPPKPPITSSFQPRKGWKYLTYNQED